MKWTYEPEYKDGRPTGAFIIADEDGECVGFAETENAARLMVAAPALQAALLSLVVLARGRTGGRERNQERRAHARLDAIKGGNKDG